MPKLRRKNNKGRRRGRRGTISDIPHNHTNITVDFFKVLQLNIFQGTVALRLNTKIAALTEELGEIYKLYRFTQVKMIFQASPETLGQLALAMNYIPANDAAPSPIVTDLNDFEGPAVGFYETNRGMPYTYKVPSKILNAMNYNWYETHTGDASDLTQGIFVFLSSIEDSFPINVYCHFKCEFQTLEDPHFLTRRITNTNEYVEIPIKKKDYFEEDEKSTNSQQSVSFAKRSPVHRF